MSCHLRTSLSGIDFIARAASDHVFQNDSSLPVETLLFSSPRMRSASLMNVVSEMFSLLWLSKIVSMSGIGSVLDSAMPARTARRYRRHDR